MKNKAIVVDVDGTIAQRNEGRPDPYDMSSNILTDDPIKPIIELVRILHYDTPEDVDVIIVSAREDTAREHTSKWLDRHGVPHRSLHMRKAKDYRPDAEVKMEIYKTLIEPNYEVMFVMDDRLSVCRMWHGLGLTVLRVGDPDSDF